MRTRLSPAIAALATCLTCQADAHAFLLRAIPGVGSEVSAPSTLRLEFTEAIELPFSGVEVTTAQGKPVEVTHVRTARGDQKVLLGDLPPLASGTYRVKWHVVSVDTHRTEGDFAFRVH